jgi:hypothetical protein
VASQAAVSDFNPEGWLKRVGKLTAEEDAVLREAARDLGRRIAAPADPERQAHHEAVFASLSQDQRPKLVAFQKRAVDAYTHGSADADVIRSVVLPDHAMGLFTREQIPDSTFNWLTGVWDEMAIRVANPPRP